MIPLNTLTIRAGVVLCVLLSYALIVSTTHYPFKLTKAASSHYQYLTEGFLSGHLSLSLAPSEKLLKLSNPYDPELNKNLRLQDASLYHNKYYLYFGVLPVVTFFLPIKFLTGWYPSESLGVFFFLSISFLIGFYLLCKIKDTFFSSLSELQLLFAGLIFGLACNSTYLLLRAVFYECAIASAFCSTMLALLFLYQFLTRQYQTRYAFFFSLFLALSVAGRPHFVLLCIVLLPLVSWFVANKVSKPHWLGLLMALFIPAGCVAILLVSYNYLRFGSILELGQHYQLCEFTNLSHFNMFDLSHWRENISIGFFCYFLHPLIFNGAFPYFHLDYWHTSIFIPQSHPFEFSAGILFTAPFLIMCIGLPQLLWFNFKNASQSRYPLIWFLIFMSIIPIITSAVLIILNGGTQRYITDFLPYFIFLGIISFWFLEEYPLQRINQCLIKYFYIVMGLYSIFVGMTFA